MKNILQHIVAVLLFVGMAACQQTADCADVVANGGETSRVAFVLQLNSADSGERGKSLPQGRLDGKIGQDFDSRIWASSLHIFVYKVERGQLSYICEVGNLSYASGRHAGEYQLQGETPVPLEAMATYRFLVTANGAERLFLPTSDGPVFSVTDLQCPDGYLPLWGVTTHQVDFSSIQYLEPIRLLRAAAKVTVRLTPELQDEGYVLEEVVLRPVAGKGYVFPKDWETAAFTAEREASFHPFDLEVPEQVFVRSAGDVEEYVAYVPEYDNIGKSPAMISVTTSKGVLEETFDAAITFQKYKDGQPQAGITYNIVRNHAYEFVIHHIDIGYGLSFESRILPWNIEEETWDYTDQVTVRSEGKMHWVEGTYQRIDPATGSVVMIPGTEMVCTFQIDTPLESEWYASFIPVSGVPDAFRFETHAVNEGRNAQGAVGEVATLRIRSVSPAVEENNVALLRIIVRTKGGRTILVKNLLPDEFQNIEEYTLVQPK